MKKINWRYAIGELIIVTLGVSLAFALNSWAGSKQEVERSKTYLSSIITDLENDGILLGSTVALTKNRLSVLYSLLPYLNGKTEGRDSGMMQFFQLIEPVVIQPHESSIQALIQSGDLSLFTNLSFKNSLLEHYDHYREMEREYDRHTTFSKEFLSSYMMENLNYATMYRSPDFSIVEDVYFKNLMYSMIGVYQISLKKQESAAASVEETLKIVKAEKEKLD